MITGNCLHRVPGMSTVAYMPNSLHRWQYCWHTGEILSLDQRVLAAPPHSEFHLAALLQKLFCAYTILPAMEAIGLITLIFKSGLSLSFESPATS